VKRKQSSYRDRPRQRFPAIALYRDDLNDIVAILKKRGLQIKFSDSDFEYESLDEFAENQGDVIRSLAISGFKEASANSIDFEFKKEGIRIRSDKEDDLVASWQEIKALLEKRIPWYARFLKVERWLWAFLFLALLGHEHVSAIATDSAPGYLFSVAIMISGYVTIYSLIHRSKNSHICLKRRHQVLSFWEKNGEKMLMLIIGAVIGAVVKGTVDLLFGKY
jgi:hypothetical protein